MRSQAGGEAEPPRGGTAQAKAEADKNVRRKADEKWRRKMQLRFFTIPVYGEERDQATEEMNSFLRGHRILSVQKEFLSNGEKSVWGCCIEYLDGTLNAGSSGSNKVKVDYRQILDENAFNRFKILRECRKQTADEEAIPPFAIMRDEQLAKLSEETDITLESFKKIEGFGEKKTEKYGKRLIELWEQKRNEPCGQSLQQDSGA